MITNETSGFKQINVTTIYKEQTLMQTAERF